MGKKCQNANICFTSVCEVLYKGEMNKPTKLRLIADLIENPRPFEVRTSGDWVSPETIPPDSFLEDRWEIRIKPESATFEAHGKTWTRHKPGDPMPCDGEAIVDILLRDNTLGSTLKAKNRWWDTGLTSSAQIIGWRYADKPAEPIMVPLVQSDVDITHKFRYAAHQGDDWLPPIGVDCTGVTFGSESRGIFRVPFDELKDSWQIKRPGEDWKPCAKPAP